jgi:hypothetical protein
VRLPEIDELVWSRVLGLLDDPTLIQAEIDRRLQTLRAAHPATTRRDALERDLTRARNALRRLIDGYQEQLVTLDELRARTPELRKREATLQAQLDALDAELHDAETYLKLTKTPEIQRWLVRHPRFTTHFTPTYSSWLNLVERWFAELTTKWIKRSAHRSVPDLVASIRTWITNWNDDPKPYVWHKTADDILDSLSQYCQRINDSGH